jgi:hypothetical protein
MNVAYDGVDSSVCDLLNTDCPLGWDESIVLSLKARPIAARLPSSSLFVYHICIVALSAKLILHCQTHFQKSYSPVGDIVAFQIPYLATHDSCLHPP